MATIQAIIPRADTTAPVSVLSSKYAPTPTANRDVDCA